MNAPRTIAISMKRMMWALNGRTFGMADLAPNERIKLGTTEDWELSKAGGMMAMPHPIHLHGEQFQVVERSAGRGFQAAGDVRDGLLDEGLRDTVLVLPGERVKIRMRFDRHPGLFLYHCHNLEHEDMGMMRNYLLEP
jgi:FtsP/CotA-like multicopper oxidase with cupredoxin domain